MKVQLFSTTPLIRYAEANNGNVFFKGEDLLKAFGLEANTPEERETIDGHEAWKIAVAGENKGVHNFELYEKLSEFIHQYDTSSILRPVSIDWDSY